MGACLALEGTEQAKDGVAPDGKRRLWGFVGQTDMGYCVQVFDEMNEGGDHVDGTTKVGEGVRRVVEGGVDRVDEGDPEGTGEETDGPRGEKEEWFGGDVIELDVEHLGEIERVSEVV
jgi:hypothetical protein